MSKGEFRIWLMLQWQEHVHEVDSYSGKLPDYDLREYFHKYKYWLKREYLYQKTWEVRDGCGKDI